MSKHTPGPWTVFPKAKYGEWHVSVPVQGQGWRLGLFPDGIRTGSPEADARLIAAAPDLLAALRELMECSEYSGWSDADLARSIAGGDRYLPMVVTARAAIAKATQA